MSSTGAKQLQSMAGSFELTMLYEITLRGFLIHSESLSLSACANSPRQTLG